MKNNFIVKFLLIYSILSKLFTSYFSILYDKSLHYQDSAVFYCMGRMVMEGKILYKEAFDHKAPYLHFVYGLASLLKERHLGLYIVEVLLLFIILLFIYKTLKLFDYKYSLFVTLFLSLFLNDCYFTQGFFKSETCALATLAPAIYLFSKYFVMDTKKFKPLDMFIIGILAGLSFMFNIRAIVLFVPFAIVVAFKLIKNKEISNLLFIFTTGILGVFVSILPYLIYAICTDSLLDFYHAVVYTNIKYTEAISTSLTKRIDEIIELLLNGWAYVAFTLFSFVALFFIKFNKYLKISFIFSYFIGIYYIFFTGKDFLYYLVIIVPYFAFGIILIIKIFEKFIGKLCYLNNSFNIKTILIATLLIIFSFAISNRTRSIMHKNCMRRTERLTSIFKEANIDYKNKKLLALGFEPMVYTCLDITPKYKYFYTPDVPYNYFPEPFSGQVDYVMNLDPDIIVFSAPLKSEGIILQSRFSVPDCYRMREAIRTNYTLLASYDMDKMWGTYKIYIKNNK